jgi:hypothetical protein
LHRRETCGKHCFTRQQRTDFVTVADPHLVADLLCAALDDCGHRLTRRQLVCLAAHFADICESHNLNITDTDPCESAKPTLNN